MKNRNILPIRLIRIAKDLSETELAEIFEVSSEYTFEVLKGLRTMDKKLLARGLQKMNIRIQDYEELRLFCEKLDDSEMPSNEKYKLALMKSLSLLNPDLKEKENKGSEDNLSKTYGLKELKDILGSIIKNQIVGDVNLREAEEFLAWLNTYTKYCFLEQKEKWQRITRETLYQELNPAYQVPNIWSNIYYRIEILHDFMNAGEIMQVFDEAKSWEEVDKILDKEGYPDDAITRLTNLLITFWPHGVEFVDRYLKDRLEQDKKFLENYENAKKNR